MLDEGLLHRRQAHDVALRVALGMAFDRADRLVGEEVRPGDAAPDLARA